MRPSPALPVWPGLPEPALGSLRPDSMWSLHQCAVIWFLSVLSWSEKDHNESYADAGCPGQKSPPGPGAGNQVVGHFLGRNKPPSH